MASGRTLPNHDLAPGRDRPNRPSHSPDRTALLSQYPNRKIHRGDARNVVIGSTGSTAPRRADPSRRRESVAG
ncbi:hypothetical protein GCM10010440_66310 [Kitasatospora cinereorecta]